MSIAHADTPHPVDEAEVRRRLEFADGALGAAGHAVTDPALRVLLTDVAAGKLSAEQAIARGLVVIDQR